MSYKSRSKRGNDNKSVARRTNKIVDISFALIATIAITIQLFLIFKYFDVRDKRNSITEKYKVAEQAMNEIKNQKLVKQSIYDGLNIEIDNLKSELERLKSQ